MIDLYAWGTTNGRRALIIAEECGLPYNLHEINLHAGEQKTEEYEKINPYRKIPALVDSDGPGGKPTTIFESVAICIYLAEKVGKFLGSPADHPNVLKWAMFHATNVVPTISLFRNAVDATIVSNVKDQFDAMNRHLKGREWFADEFSIADIIPFTRVVWLNHDQVDVSDYLNVANWVARVSGRPAVQKAMAQKFG